MSKRFTTRHGAALWLIACLTAVAAAAPGPAAPLKLLTTAHAVHSLTIPEAARAYPVHLRAVVTYFDPYTSRNQSALFVTDASGTIYVAVPTGSVPMLPPGALVDIRGESAKGNFAPIVQNPHITLLGQAHLPPEPPRVSLTYLRTGAEDGQWVEVEGVVHSLAKTQHNVVLQLAMSDGTISVTMLREPDVDYDSLVDATIRIECNAAPLFNGRGQLTGARLVSPGSTALKILDPAPHDPFARPALAIDSLSQFSPITSSPHRVHIRGTVTLQWRGTLLCVRDATHGLCAQTVQTTPLAIGALADVAGFVALGEDAPVLTDAAFAGGGNGVAVPAAQHIAAEGDALVFHDADLVQLDGLLMGRDLAALDTTLMLSSGNFIIPVVLPRGLTGPEANQWKNGSRLRVTGICSVQMDARSSAGTGGFPVAQSFRILLRSPSDVIVTRKASWWTPGHGLLLATTALLIALGVLGWVAVLRKRVRESEGRYRHLALHDTLTGLPTRMLLHDRLDAAIERARRYDAGLALLMLDLDNFKHINDSLGHDAGDETLRVTAARMTAAVRGSDTVARMGGDEFIVLLADLTEPEEAERVAAKIVLALSANIRINDRDLPVSVSAGVCTAFGADLDSNALLQNVDTALYQAKGKGRNCYQLFTPDMALAGIERQRLEDGLSRALEQKEFELHYQPMISFKTGLVTGFEVLLRWKSKDLGIVMPLDFIPAAEESGLIVPIGEWQLREACREIGLLERQLARTFMLAVNLSPRQFQHHELLAMVERALADAGRRPSCLEFEITESMLMGQSSRTAANLSHLHDLGVHLAIDDFGIGFSSLSYITRFSIDRIKIDQSFIHDCTTNSGSLAVVRAILAMAHGLNIQVVAEGVEAGEQFRFLQQEGCDTTQGFYFSEALPARDLPGLVRSLEMGGKQTTHHEQSLAATLLLPS